MTVGVSEESSQVHMSEPFEGLLPGIANHEAKLALTAIIASQPDRWFSGTEFYHEIISRQGSEPGWVPDHKWPIKSCVNSLEPVGLVTLGTVTGERGDTTAFKSNDENPQIVDLGYALSGAGQEWSIDYPNISVQKVLGITAMMGAYRTPLIRYKILEKLIVNPTEDESYHTIASAVTDGHVDVQDVNSNIRELARAGILRTHVKDISMDVKLRIVDPEFRHTGLEFYDLKHESQIAYGALRNLWLTGKREISFRELVDQALLLDPTLDAQKLRQTWHNGASARNNSMPGLILADQRFNDPRRLTSVSMEPEHAEALTELVTRLGKIKAGAPDTLASYQEQALSFINNPPAMAKLFEKARTFSYAVAGQEEGREVIEDRIITFIKTSSQMSILDVFRHLRDSGQPLTKGSVTHYLRNMTKTGKLISEKRRIDNTKRREILCFSVPDDL